MGRRTLIEKRFGEGHPRAKLCARDVEMARCLHDEGLTYRAIATRLGVSKWCIARICRFERRAMG